MRLGPPSVSPGQRLLLLALGATPLWLRWLWTPLCVWRGYCLATSDGKCAICQGETE